MAKKLVSEKAKKGRPVTVGATMLISSKWPPALVERIDQWAGTKGVGRSEAMRQLIEAGLKKPPKVGA
ncbi:ribbon-helix-helix protein, CopG family [Reyranella soli]|uniref:Ribbon-helix-helix protein CopG domain-containing protein n=1 Tax=Reyranella soli TaxID=1230389 RepID=A0A512NEI3_9HYPH|nr:ribbon-helix-helix protein, CopG family [Reyranella soli]GEP57344.1 hypothetical protein RSO01_45100 [Reyranella soli]